MSYETTWHVFTGLGASLEYDPSCRSLKLTSFFIDGHILRFPMFLVTKHTGETDRWCILHI